MFSSRLAFVFALSAGFLSRTSTYRTSTERILVPCLSDATCSQDMPGSTCINSICVCMVQNGCTISNITSASNQIGEGCILDEECLIEHSKCSTRGKCECISGWSPSEDKKKCIEVVPQPLGSNSDEPDGCSITSAECKNSTKSEDGAHNEINAPPKSLGSNSTETKSEEIGNHDNNEPSSAVVNTSVSLLFCFIALLFC